MPLNIELLERSFEQIKPRADEFTASFYENLFAIHPEIKPLFANTDMAIQRKKLFNVLVLIVESFRNREVLEPVLKALGARHVGYGVVPKYYPGLGKALLVTLKQYLQQDWTPEVKQAWVSAFKAITAVMLKGAGVDYAPKDVELEKNAISKNQPVPAIAAQNVHKLEEVTEQNLEKLSVELLEKNGAEIKPDADKFVVTSYDNPFALESEAKPLFAQTDITTQQKNILNAFSNKQQDIAPEKVQLETQKKQPVASPAIQTQHKVEAVSSPESEELPVELLEKTFALIKPRANEFVASFYDNLFAAHPEIKPLFGSTDMAIQRKKLINTLVLVVEGLRNSETLAPVLSALGARHVGYGAIPKYYGPVVKALLMTFEQYLQQDWTPEVKRAWTKAFQTITAQMLKGAGELSSPTVVRDQKAATTEKPRELKAEIKIESQHLQPQVEQHKKLQVPGEILKKTNAQITSTARQSVANIKQIPAKIIDTFWQLPTWSIALVATLIMSLIFVFEDENSALGKILGGTDAISLVVAVVLFIKEAPDRKKQFHYQAWSIIDGASGLKVSYARLLAMQDLNEDGVSLRELNAPGAELDDINLPGANLSEANLSEADMSNGNLSKANLGNANLSKTKLSGANLSHANLSFARLSGANLSSANLNEANLICTDLSNANMSGANLKNASLSGANLNGALLIGANLKGAKVSSYDLSGAALENAIMPDGSKYKSESD